VKPITIRPLATQEDYHACTALQEEVWGIGFSEKVSVAILMVSQRVGGISAGAFDEAGRWVGFVFGLTGVEGGEVVHWSDMLAVHPDQRDRGLGSRLKRYQREALLGMGVRKMYWTFDPLQSRNAYVNFAKLGIISREYVPDMYGETDSPLHTGIGTDRLLALWLLDSERVNLRLSDDDTGPVLEEVEGLPLALDVNGDGEFPAPGPPRLDLDADGLLVPVPAELDSLKNADLPLALLWRRATREAFLHYLSRGYEAQELIRGRTTSWYLLARGAGPLA
jgi:predicted GNAT superfamily acetyltransferase